MTKRAKQALRTVFGDEVARRHTHGFEVYVPRHGLLELRAVAANLDVAQFLADGLAADLDTWKSIRIVNARDGRVVDQVQGRMRA